MSIYDILVIARMSVNNKDIIWMHLGYNWLISQKTVPIKLDYLPQIGVIPMFATSIEK